MPKYVILQAHHLGILSMPTTTQILAAEEAYFQSKIGKADDAVTLGLYKARSVVEADNPEDLFKKTQSLDRPWTQVNPPLAGDVRQQSTSCGDFILEIETGKVQFCDFIGWKDPTIEIANMLKDAAKETFADLLS